MSTSSSKLGLTKPDAADTFTVTSFQTNYQLIDDSPGIYIGSTSAITSKVAAWGASQDGMRVWDTTTDTMYRWDWTGSTGSLVLAGPRGLISRQVDSSPHTVTNGTSPIWQPTFTAPISPRTLRAELFIPTVTSFTTGTLTVSLQLKDSAATIFIDKTYTQATILPGQQGINIVGYGTPVATGTVSVEVRAFTDSSGNSATIGINSAVTVTEI